MKTIQIFIITFIVLANFYFPRIEAQALFVPGGSGGIGNNTANGNVGIGTSTPNSILQINSWANSQNLQTARQLIISGDNWGGLGLDKLGAADHKYGLEIGYHYNYGQYTKGGRIQAYAAGCVSLMLNPDGGNVGIGTSNPLNKLDVSGTLGLYGDGLDGSDYQRSVIYSDTRYGLYFDAPLKADGTGLPINFGWRGGSSKVTFLQNGNVLIGKTTQTGTGVKYKLDVEGPIRAHEIVVNTTGADFVFEPTYKLRSLTELETFIRTNKHLPDIAPAKEMQQNGVSAGEMQAKLLQKVEELTLYVIEKDKEIAALKTEKDKQIAGLQMILTEMKKEIEILKTK